MLFVYVQHHYSQFQCVLVFFFPTCILRNSPISAASKYSTSVWITHSLHSLLFLIVQLCGRLRSFTFAARLFGTIAHLLLRKQVISFTRAIGEWNKSIINPFLHNWPCIPEPYCIHLNIFDYQLIKLFFNEVTECNYLAFTLSKINITIVA